MVEWSARQYLKFADERTRAVRELAARVPLRAPRVIVDIGCGPGNSTEVLAELWPEAQLSGFDTSPDMLATARQRLPQVAFSYADAASFVPAADTDLLFSNAVFQWVPDHPAVLERLFRALKPGGVLAVQMPDNMAEPTHRLPAQLAAEGPWAAALAQVQERPPLPSPGAYYDLLCPHAAGIDIWHAVYNHVMADAGAIVEWVSGTGLRPYLEALEGEQRAAFVAAYREALAQAYPARADGRRLLRFPRLFLVAVRG